MWNPHIRSNAIGMTRQDRVTAVRRATLNEQTMQWNEGTPNAFETTQLVGNVHDVLITTMIRMATSDSIGTRVDGAGEWSSQQSTWIS